MHTVREERPGCMVLVSSDTSCVRVGLFLPLAHSEDR